MKLNYEKQNKLINDLAQEKIKYEEEIKSLKRKLIYSNINTSNPYFKQSESNKSSKNSLYESLIIFIKNLNINHIYDLFESRNITEEPKKKLQFESKNSNDISKIKSIYNLVNEFREYRINCESLLNEYDKRSKLYINPEVIKLKLRNIQLIILNSKNTVKVCSTLSSVH